MRWRRVVARMAELGCSPTLHGYRFLASCQCFSSSLRSEERRVGKECRSRCDWSSDVCSSDLDALEEGRGKDGGTWMFSYPPWISVSRVMPMLLQFSKIGRASCRERV